MSKIQMPNPVIVFVVFFVLLIIASNHLQIPHKKFILLTVFASPLLGLQAWLALVQYRILAAIPTGRREVSQNSVFLCLIPVVGQIWNFYLIKRTNTSLENEFEFRGFDLSLEKFGLSLGRSWAWMNLVITVYLFTETYFQIVLDFSILVLIFVAIGFAINAWTSGLRYGKSLNRLERYLLDHGVAFQSQDQRDFDEEE